MPLRIEIVNAPGRIRICGLSLRRRTLYPTELREHTNLGFWISVCGLSSLRIVSDQRTHVVAVELFAPVEKIELDDEQQADDLAA